jgi:hypothetical protein
MPAVALTIGVALVASILVVVPYLSLDAPTPNMPRRVFALDPHKYYGRSTSDEPVTMKALKPADLRPNSFVWFLDPYGKTMQKLGDNKTEITLNKQTEELFQNRDAYENYMLIRLPEWMGGEKGDTSALRAYHAISLSDMCISRYFGDDGRWRIENPCAGDMYRPWDGCAFAGPASAGTIGFVPSKGFYPALQKMRLATDNEGYVVAFRPDTSPQADGSQGEGRKMSPADLEESNRALIAEEGRYLGYALPFPPSVQGYRLAELGPAGAGAGQWQVALGGGHNGPREAVYSSDNNNYYYRSVTMDVFSLRQFPDMALGGPMARASGSGYTINSTLASSLLYLDYGQAGSGPPLQMKNWTDVAGDYALLVANEDRAGALVWGRSADGRTDILVSINARDATIDDLVQFVKALNISHKSQ